MRLAVAWLLVAHSVFSAALSKALMSYRGPAVQDRAARGRALRHLIKHTNFRYTTFLRYVAQQWHHWEYQKIKCTVKRAVTCELPHLSVWICFHITHGSAKRSLNTEEYRTNRNVYSQTILCESTQMIRESRHALVRTCCSGTACVSGVKSSFLLAVALACNEHTHFYRQHYRHPHDDLNVYGTLYLIFFQ